MKGTGRTLRANILGVRVNVRYQVQPATRSSLANARNSYIQQAS